MFGPLVVGILPKLDQPVTHQRSQSVGQRRYAYRQALGQRLQCRAMLPAEKIGLGKQGKLRCFQTCRRDGFVIEVAKPACGKA